MKNNGLKLSKNIDSFDNFVEIIRTLRGPKGCPWDLKQTHESLARYAIEEVYELVEAIENKNKDEICDELGDVLLQVVLNSVIAEQNKSFSIENVIRSIAEKMIRRHPHVFSDEKFTNADEVHDNWQKIKDTEKANTTKPKNSFNLSKSLPSLLASQKIGEKTKKADFDWRDIKGVIAKVDEELQELKEAIDEGEKKEINHELGDLLFSVSQLGRHLELDSESSLREANKRFESRFFNMVDDKTLDEFANLKDEEKEALWNKVKQQEKQGE